MVGRASGVMGVPEEYIAFAFQKQCENGAPKIVADSIRFGGEHSFRSGNMSDFSLREAQRNGLFSGICCFLTLYW
jgi:hypothetical protein